MKTLKVLFVSTLLSSAVAVQAANIEFNLQGTAGAGLLFGNEPAVASGGTGGEIGAGIFYNDATNTLFINVGWGSSQGFANLSSAANNSHIHGPTAAVNGSGFTQTAGVLFTLNRSSDLATGGTSSQAFALSTAQQTDLFNGKYYINIHTANNGGGEIRGFLVPVPEPSTYALAGLGLAGLVALRLRRQ